MPRPRLQLSLRELMLITAGCAVVFLVFARMLAGETWAAVTFLVLGVVVVLSPVLLALERYLHKVDRGGKRFTLAPLPPPADLNRELFASCRAGNDGRVDAIVRVDQRELRIEPPSFPARGLIVVGAIWVSLGGGFWMLLRYLGVAQPWVWMVPLALTIVWCLGMVVVFYISRRQTLLGPWLIYDKSSRRVRLPRHGEECELSEVVHLQYLMTEVPDRPNEGRISELNLITCRGAQRQQWHLLLSETTHRAFDRMVRPLVEQTELPVVRIVGHRHDWNVTIEPYERPAR